MTIFKEEEHPRDGDGKFTKGGNESKVIVDSNALGNYSNIKELRQKAEKYYKNNLAGSKVENKELGEIIFSHGGFEKPISFSGDYRKLLLFPYLKEIVASGKVVDDSSDTKGREKNHWFLLKNSVVLDGKKLDVGINIRQDNNGKFYYDHFIVKEKPSLANLPTNADGNEGYNNSIIKNSSNVKQNLQLNLLITSETYLMENDRIIIANKKYSLDNSKK
ncbi:MAG: hypothetical protein LBS34_00945 [Rickettsiales bacterium]|jgi:hypothetical protein|nr:hypothetical protein [Rickettsiales bacterium]